LPSRRCPLRRISPIISAGGAENVIHELPDWPRFHWDPGTLSELLASVRHWQGRLIGHMEALGFDLRREAVLRTLTGDVVKSSEIEGEKLVG
jgi:Fic family protein